MNKDHPVWIMAVMAIFVLVLVNLVFSVKISETKKSLSVYENTKRDINHTNKIRLGKSCPDSIGGDASAYLRIKYFYSDYCPWCKKEEPILLRIIGEYGGLAYVEWHNIALCPKEADDYKVSGVPTFIFATSDNHTEYSHYGFIYEEDIRNLICDVTGGC